MKKRPFHRERADSVNQIRINQTRPDPEKDARNSCAVLKVLNMRFISGPPFFNSFDLFKHKKQAVSTGCQYILQLCYLY